MPILIVLLVAGLAVLALGVREGRLHRRLRREGVRVTGTVVRYVRSPGDDSPGQSLFAVVGFTDAAGNRAEVKATSSGTDWPIGHPVPVIHLPGAPATARIDLNSERRSRALVFALVGGGFTILPIVLLALGQGHT
jgi:hypothetical protein